MSQFFKIFYRFWNMALENERLLLFLLKPPNDRRSDLFPILCNTKSELAFWQSQKFTLFLTRYYFHNFSPSNTNVTPIFTDVKYDWFSMQKHSFSWNSWKDFPENSIHSAQTFCQIVLPSKIMQFFRFFFKFTFFKFLFYFSAEFR